MNKKEYELLKVLSEHKNAYMTSNQLAQVINVSNKTVQKYIHLLNDELKSVHASVVSTKGLGYQLVVQSLDLFEQWVVKEKHQLQVIDIHHIETPEDRQYFILYQLFFNTQDVLTVSYFCDLLFVSKTVIMTDLQQIKQTLEPWQLRVLKKSNDGLYICGSEKTKRQCLMQLFFNDSIVTTLFEYSQYTNLLKDVPLEHLMIIVMEECRRHQLNISDYVLHNLVLHLALAVKRLKMGQEIEYQVLDGLNKQSASYHVAHCITTRLIKELHINFPLEEANYIALHLSVKCHDDTQLKINRLDDLATQLQSAIKQFGQYYLLADELANDMELLNGLHSHFMPLLTRLEQNVPLYHPLLAEMMTMYAIEIERTQSIFSKIPCLSKYTLSIDEAAYIALHLLATMERLKNKKKQRVLVICASGFGSAQMVKNRLEREFDSYLEIDDVISYHELTTRDLQQIDFIVSTIQIDNVLYPIPVICISTFLSDEDILRIKEQLTLPQTIVKTDTKTRGNKQQILSLFSEQHFLVLENITKKEVLDKMINTIFELSSQPLKQQFINRLNLREQYGGVAFNEYVAIPHPTQAMTDKAYCVVAICPNGIAWNEQYQHIKVIILLSPSIYHNQHIKELSQMLAEVIQDTKALQRVIEYPTFNQFIQIITAFYQEEEKKQ